MKTGRCCTWTSAGHTFPHKSPASLHDQVDAARVAPQGLPRQPACRSGAARHVDRPEDSTTAVWSPHCASKESGIGHMSNSGPGDSSNSSPTNYLPTNMQEAASGLPTQFPATPPNSAFHVTSNCATANFLESHFAVAAPNSWASSRVRRTFPQSHTMYFCSLQTLFHEHEAARFSVSASASSLSRRGSRS